MKFAAFGRTQWLYDAIRLAISRGHEPVLIGTCASSPEYRIKESHFERLASDLGCPFFNDVHINDDMYVDLARASQARVALTVNWRTLIGSAMIDAFPLGILNAHAGDLPRYRGNACPNWAILAGESHIGACVHLAVSELDAGPVVVRSRFPLTESTYIGEVYDFLNAEFPRMLVEGMEGLENKSLIPEAQASDPMLSLRCFPRRPEDGLIDWSRPVEEISRLIRASAEPFSGAFTYLGSRKLTVWRAKPQKLLYPWLGVPGQVVEILPQGKVTVLCSDGVMSISEVQIDGSAREPLSAVVRSTRARLCDSPKSD